MVYFICRSEYESPHGRRIIEFPDAPNLVDWFKKQWITRKELTKINPKIPRFKFDPWDWQNEIQELRADAFGGSFYGFCDLFAPMFGRPAPRNLSDIEDFIDSFKGNYSEGSIEMIDGAIQASTNDDEIEIAWYLFDDTFVEQFPERTAFLLHKQLNVSELTNTKSWIPPVQTKVIADGDQATFCCFFSAQDGITIADIEGCYRVPTHLPELGSWLSKKIVKTKPEKYGTTEPDLPPDLILLRAFALLEDNHCFEGALRSFDSFNRKLSSWLPRVLSGYQYHTKDPLFLATDPSLITEQLQALSRETQKSGEKGTSDYWVSTNGETYFQFSAHFCQVVFSEISTAHNNPDEVIKYFKHWVFFDDLWASANQDLAESILKYGQGESILGS